MTVKKEVLEKRVRIGLSRWCIKLKQKAMKPNSGANGTKVCISVMIAGLKTIQGVMTRSGSSDVIAQSH